MPLKKENCTSLLPKVVHSYLRNIVHCYFPITKIYNELHFKFFVSTKLFEHTSDWNIDEILAVLSKFKQEEIKRHEHLR